MTVEVGRRAVGGPPRVSDSDMFDVDSVNVEVVTLRQDFIFKKFDFPSVLNQLKI